MKRYGEYKKSPEFWIPNIPAHWRLEQLSKICRQKYVKNAANREKHILSLSYGNIVDKKNADFGLSPKDYATYQIVYPEDIILRLTDLQNDKNSLRTGIVRKRGIITSAYVCITTTQNPYFLHYFLHYLDIIKVFYGLGSGVRQSIGYKDIKYLVVPIPPCSEQDQIVRFLDYKLAKIDSLIAIKQRQIELLKEKRQAIINKAVIKGIYPDPRMKDSGVKWIGEINNSFSIVSLKKIITGELKYGANEASQSNNINDPRYIRITDIDENNQLKSDTFASLPFEVAQKYILKDGDILFARSGATVGKTFLYRDKYGICCYAGYLVKCSINSCMANPEYIMYYTQSNIYKSWINSINIQATIQNISANKYRELFIPLPALHIQNEIIIYLNKITKIFQHIESKILSQIKLFLEYRSRLISDAVTGAIDVREYKIPEDEPCQAT